MSDNVTADAGTGGAVFATDDISSVHFPRQKLVFGADGSNDGDVDDALPLPTNSAFRTDVMQNANTQLTPLFAAIAASSSGDNTIVAAVAGKVIRVIAGWWVSAGTVTTRWEDGAGGTALSGQAALIANTGVVLPFNPVGWFETSSNTLLNLELSGAVSVAGSITYVTV